MLVRPHTAPADSIPDNRSGSIDTSTRSDTERSHLSRFHDVNSSNRLKFDSPPVDAPTTNSEPSSKRRRSCSPSVFPNKKAKAKQDELLDDLSDEISCPICFDLLVGAHLLNPCGHTLCGPCSYTWITLKKQTTCPVCRTKCCHYKSLIPNIIVDNIVEKYIEIQVARGDEVWDVGGSKRIDWEQRLDKWRRNVNCTRAPPKKVQPTQNIVDPDILFGMHAIQSSNTHVPRSIFELLAGQ
ncbi:RING/U-box [Dendrothele bispora CBS 962.96]|uniref:RING/U-box n=1 Tax=Dendrothele bispora (strain CBS 962.96) TaxID=1314807 RepID=A0A4S8MSH8_DENBC|nr:RING/U-box [Dendrothele bispora CBS 962.96]